MHAVTQQAAFARSLFPVGELDKSPRFAALADKHWALSPRTKKDSTGICFIGERRFKDFLEQYLPAQPGERCVTPEGDCLSASTRGLMFYTLGQRQGLGYWRGKSSTSDEPWYRLA